MRYVAFALILLTLPLFVAWLKQRPDHRRHALMLLGLGFFLSGAVQIEASLIAWPAWSGTVKGTTVSMVDMLALALIATRARSSPRLPLLWIVLCYIGVVLVSLSVASVPMASFFYLFQLVRVTMIYIAIAPELARVECLRGLFKGLSLGLILQACFVASEKASGVVQAHGTMAHQNTLGMMAELAVIPVIGALLAGVRSPLLTLGAASGLFIAAAGGSRATMAITVAGAAVLIVLSLIQNSNGTKLKIAGLGLVAGLVIAPVAVYTLNSRFGDSSVLAGDEQRIAMEKAASAMASDHVLGVGSNLYVTVANTGGYSERAGVTWGGATRAAPVHNAFLLARSETGWLGEGLFILLFLVPIVGGLRHAFKNRRALDGSAALASAVALGAVAFHSQYEFAAQTAGPQALIFINIAIVAGMIQIRLGMRSRSQVRPISISRNTPPAASRAATHAR